MTTTTVSCKCKPAHNVTEQGNCLKCGRPRGVVTRAWVDDDGLPGDATEPLQLALEGLEPQPPRTTSEAKALAWRRLEHLRELQEGGRL